MQAATGERAVKLLSRLTKFLVAPTPPETHSMDKAYEFGPLPSTMLAPQSRASFQDMVSSCSKLSDQAAAFDSLSAEDCEVLREFREDLVKTIDIMLYQADDMANDMTNKGRLDAMKALAPVIARLSALRYSKAFADLNVAANSH
jgi:hypothetical protein